MTNPKIWGPFEIIWVGESSRNSPSLFLQFLWEKIGQVSAIKSHNNLLCIKATYSACILGLHICLVKGFLNVFSEWVHNYIYSELSVPDRKAGNSYSIWSRNRCGLQYNVSVIIIQQSSIVGRI